MFGQKTWTLKDKQYSFVATIDTVLCGGISGEYCPTVTAIHIYTLDDKKQIQTIIPEQFLFDGFLDSSIVFAVEDMNFDGNTDIRLLKWASTNTQTTYCYWLYDSVTGKFERDTALDVLRNPAFDSTTKTIHTWWRDGFYSSGHALYEWHENKLRLIAEEEAVCEMELNSICILRTKRRKNGTVNVTELEVKEYELDYMHHSNKCTLHKK
ncbi:MAG: XAC2610-related protein [Bacteroidia bacterium]